MKIVILDGYSANPGDLSWQPLEAIGELTVYDRTKPEETILRAKDADIILTNKVLVKRPEIEQLPKLRYIGVLATGYNVVDVEAAREHGIICSSRRPGSARCSAISLSMVSLSKRVKILM